MMAIAWASVGAGAGAKRLANVTAPTNQLLGAECGEFCSWNNVNQILATAMDVGERWKFPVRASLVMFRIIDKQQHEPQPVSPRPGSTPVLHIPPPPQRGEGGPACLQSIFLSRGRCNTRHTQVVGSTGAPRGSKARGPVASGCNRWPGAIHHTSFCSHPYVLPCFLFGSLLGVFCPTRICSHAPCLFLQSLPSSLTSWLIGLRWSSPSLSRTCTKGVQKGVLAPSQPGCVLEETVRHQQLLLFQRACMRMSVLQAIGGS